MHFDVVSCVKVVHKSSQVDCNFLIAERKPENDSTGFKPMLARFFFGRYLNQSYYKGRSDENI